MIPIPDSSRPSALELANRLGIKYREGFVKNRYIGRTFIMPGQAMRKKSVRQKLNPVGIEFKDKVVLLVDDSIVRGTTSREIVMMAREAGAQEGVLRVGGPPVRYPNVYGIDMPNQHELVATGRTEAEIAREIGADLLIYQDLDALKDAVRTANPQLTNFEASCFDGKYITGDITADYLSHLAIERDEARGERAEADLLEEEKRRSVVQRCSARTAKISTAAPIPLKVVGPSASVAMRPPSASHVALSIRIARPAAFVCASMRAARFTVSPMHVYVARALVPA